MLSLREIRALDVRVREHMLKNGELTHAQVEEALGTELLVDLSVMVASSDVVQPMFEKPKYRRSEPHRFHLRPGVTFAAEED